MTDEMSSSQTQLSSASSSTSASPAKLCSKTYKKASQLYLTRRLPDSLESLQPILTIPSSQDEHLTNGDHSAAVATIATAPSTWRIKVWNLYITLLSAIVDLGAEEGKVQFGHKEWKAIATQVREGGIWENVVQIGYRGQEGSVDAEVVFNLATLILNHSSSQALNQQRLETYLSSYGQPNLDLTDRLQDASNGLQSSHITTGNGTHTPKDLNARVRIIEIFTLHVLPRNGEWDYAQEFINLSEVLDEERKELFLQTLEGLKEEKERGEMRAAELQRQKDLELERQREDERRQAEEEAAQAAAASTNGHKRNASEVDYGIDKSGSRSKAKGSTKSGEKLTSSSKGGSRSSLSSNSKSSKKAGQGSAPKPSTGHREYASQPLREDCSTDIGQPYVNSTYLALSPRHFDGYEQTRITGSAWQKVKGTVGMGVKVSYI
ncbi:hypothetical protein N7539_003525 [Penicillium diatomitis]|uniref:Uncharacterized protein n=1 Tax=Penicillium diatomitis TaxID=2819901 RepID=A0A9X0BXD3_9EURO|nr:uncharacterized protein N7539_003525 [Penicillium diatomitis]KAJ5488635.1 hypothetical protein N7539_003525 [Penicillium diatomitis]